MTVVDRPTISEQFFDRFHAQCFPNKWKMPSIYRCFYTRPRRARRSVRPVSFFVRGGRHDSGRGRYLRCQRGGCAGGYDHRDAAADEIGCERRQPIILVLCIPVLDRHVLALNIPRFLQALEKWNSDVLGIITSSLEAEVSNNRHRRLLGPRHHRPRRRAPEPRDELPPFH
jgi:hypothetical protein